MADVIKLGDHGTTFGCVRPARRRSFSSLISLRTNSGQPLQTRVAHHVVSRIGASSFLSNVSSVGDSLKARLANVHALFPRLVAGPPRGRGLILGLPLTRDEYVQKVVKLMRERGVLVLSCGRQTVRFVPSLIATEADVEKVVDVLESSLVVLNRQEEGL